jgi:hypothetical protein
MLERASSVSACANSFLLNEQSRGLGYEFDVPQAKPIVSIKKRIPRTGVLISAEFFE